VADWVPCVRLALLVRRRELRALAPYPRARPPRVSVDYPTWFVVSMPVVSVRQAPELPPESRAAPLPQQAAAVRPELLTPAASPRQSAAVRRRESLPSVMRSAISGPRYLNRPGPGPRFGPTSLPPVCRTHPCRHFLTPQRRCRVDTFRFACSPRDLSPLPAEWADAS
jgi:hypothetical protein